MAATGETVVVTMAGGGPWGFRLYGGDHDPLIVAKLRRKSKAQEAGLVEGDALLGVSGYSCQGASHATVMGLVDSAGDTLTMHVLRGNSERHVYDAALQALGSQLQPIPASAIVQASPAGGRSPAPGFSPARDTTAQAPQPAQVSLNLQPVNGNMSTAHSPSQFSRQHQTYNDSGVTTDVTTETSQENFGGTTVTKTRREIVTRAGFGPSAQQQQAAPPPAKPGIWAPTGGGGGGVPKPFHTAGGAPSVNQPVTMTVDFGGAVEKENIAPQVSPAQQAPMFKINKYQPDKVSPAAAPTSSGGTWQPSHVPAAPPKRRPPSPGMDFSPPMEHHNQFQQQQHDLMSSVPPHVQKILAGDSGSDFDSDTETGFMSRRKIDATMMCSDDDSPLLSKKMFADSAFYDDPEHKYPTIEEQIKMARKVALSLTAPANKKARGHRMFMKRVNKADKWTSDKVGGEITMTHFVDNDDEEPYYNPNPWAGDGHTWQPAPAIERSGPQQKWDIPKAPPLPPINLFAPSLPKGKDKEEKSKALSAEEFERMRLYEQKTDHSTVSPQVCFNLAEDLRAQKGKGGKMFAKRAAKSEKWVVDEPTQPNPELMQRLLGAAPSGAATMDDIDNTRMKAPANTNDGGQPVNRLQEMIDPPKAKMSPWEAMAEFGDVDKAFDHLRGYHPYGKSYKSKVAENLESATGKHQMAPGSFTPSPQKGMPMGGGPAVLPEFSSKIKPWGRDGDSGNGSSQSHNAAPPPGVAPVQFKLPSLPTTSSPAADYHHSPGHQPDSHVPKPFQQQHQPPPQQHHPTTGPSHAAPSASFSPMSRGWASTTELNTNSIAPSSLAGSSAFGSTAAISGPSPSAGAAGGFRPVKFKLTGMDGGASPGPSGLHPSATGAATFQRQGVSPAPSGGSGAACVASEEGYCDL